MKKAMAFLITLTATVCLCVCFTPTVLLAQDSTATGIAGDSGSSVGDFLKENWGSILVALLVFVESIVRLTKTERDNSILNFIKLIVDAILPNKAKDGGRLGFLPPKDATTCNTGLKDLNSGKVIDPGTKEVIEDPDSPKLR